MAARLCSFIALRQLLRRVAHRGVALHQPAHPGSLLGDGVRHQLRLFGGRADRAHQRARGVPLLIGRDRDLGDALRRLGHALP